MPSFWAHMLDIAQLTKHEEWLKWFLTAISLLQRYSLISPNGSNISSKPLWSSWGGQENAFSAAPPPRLDSGRQWPCTFISLCISTGSGLISYDRFGLTQVFPSFTRWNLFLPLISNFLCSTSLGHNILLPRRDSKMESGKKNSTPSMPRLLNYNNNNAGFNSQGQLLEEVRASQECAKCQHIRIPWPSLASPVCW